MSNLGDAGCIYSYQICYFASFLLLTATSRQPRHNDHYIDRLLHLESSQVELLTKDYGMWYAVLIPDRQKSCLDSATPAGLLSRPRSRLGRT